MIDLTIPTVAQVKKQFNDALINGAGQLAPRNGFYYVRAFEYRDVNNRNNVPIITANWKARRDDLFLESAVFEIAVSCFPLHNAIFTDVNFTTIVGRTVQVYDMGLSKSTVNGKEKALLNGKWMYEIAEHNFYKSSVFFELMRSIPRDGQISNVNLGIDLTDDSTPLFDDVEDLDENMRD